MKYIILDHHNVVITCGHLLNIYDNTNLVWAAKTMDIEPIAVQVISRGPLKGMLVCMDMHGTVEAGYLGTTPSPLQVSSMARRALDYESMEKEMVDLHRQIADASKGNMKS